MIHRLPLRGRDAALDELAERIAQARAGSGAVLVFEGARGMGKSRLLEEAGAIAGRSGIGVSHAAAVAGAQLVPLAPLRDALRTVDRGMDLIASLEHGRDAVPMLEPQLICLDDLHWADAATLTALHTLSASLHKIPLAVVVALDPAQMRDASSRAAAPLRARVALEALDDAAVLQLAKDALGVEPAPALQQLLHQARGVPAELEALLLGLAEEGRVVVQDGQSHVRSLDALPARMHTRVRERLSKLDALGRQLAVAAAVLGPDCTPRQLAVMVERRSVSDTVGELVAAGFVERRADGRLQLLGVETRQLLLSTLSQSAVTALQRQAAALLVSEGATALTVADQVLAGARPGDGSAARTLLEAAQSLLAVDPSQGADLCRQAITLPDYGDPVRAELATAAVRLLHAAGRTDEARTWAARWGQDLATPVERAAVLLEASELFSLPADVCAEANRRALALDGIDAVSRARHQAGLILNLAMAGRLPEAQRQLEETAKSIADAGDPRADSTCALAESVLDIARGQYERALPEPASAGWTDSVRADCVAILRCSAVLTAGRLEDALDISNAGTDASRQHGQHWAARMWTGLRLRALLALGRPLEVLVGVEPYVPARVPEAAALAAVATAAIHVGDLRATQACAAAARVASDDAPPEVRQHAAWVILRCADASGDEGGIATWAGHAHVEQGAALPRLEPSPGDAVVLTRLALSAGDPELARAAAARAGARALLNPGSAYLSAFAAHAAALVADAPAGLAEAAAQLQEAGAVLARASVLEDLGQMSLRAVTTRADGIRWLDEALATYERAGAERDAARVRRRLRGAAQRRRPTARPAPASDRDELTAAERRVVELVASGLTNREVGERLSISANTVGTHLRHAFAKLGVSSRRELVLRALTPPDAP